MLNKISNKKLVFILVFLFIIFFVYLLFMPLFNPIAFGAIVSGVFFKLYLKINKKLKNKRNIASSITLLIISFIIVFPSIYIIINISKEMFSFFSHLNKLIQELSVEEILNKDNMFSYYLNKLIIFLDIEINSVFLKQFLFDNVKNLSTISIRIINTWLNNFLSLLFDFFIMLLVIHGIFTKGDVLKAFLVKLSPLPKEEEELVLKKFNEMNYVTLLSNGIGGLIQGLLAGFAFWIVGFETIILWTIVMVFLAFIPIIGISLVYIPASIYLFSIGNIYSAIFLLIFCSALSFIVENWFKSKFVGDKIKVNSILVLLSIIGGLNLFGIAGIFYGPLILIIFLTVNEIYNKNYLNKN